MPPFRRPEELEDAYRLSKRMIREGFKNNPIRKATRLDDRTINKLRKKIEKENADL